VCGIAGIIASEVEPTSLERMLEAMHHRGPDDRGIEIFGHDHFQVGLGNTRLAIIDLSPAGHMPMRDPETGNWIVYNGEVYNYRELRAELVKHGKHFRSLTDTEVILKAYAEWGLDCLGRLRGMFAFAIWDGTRGELVLARDRLGEKPLYYYADPERGLFVFASEVRALLASGLVPRLLDHSALSIYLHNGFLVSPRTLVRGVRSLLPGHWMRIDARGQVAGQGRYWRIPSSRTGVAEEARSRERLEALRETLAEATAQRLVSDVPLGVFLSGGLDSSTIVALMTRCSNAIRTFSVGFPEPDFDESTYAQWVSSRFRTEHRTVSVTAEEFARWLPDGLAAMDQPTFDGLNTYCVARTARASGLTVALSGLGGDELFGGYPHFRQVPAIARGARFGTWLPDLPRRLVTRFVGGLHGWRKVVQVIGSPVPGYYAMLGAYQVAQALFPASFQRRLLQRYEEVEGVWFGLPLEFVAFVDNDGRDGDELALLSRYTIRLFEGERLLRDTDSMGMANSLEIRTVFTDHAFIEAVWEFPGRTRCAGAPNKPFEVALVRPLLGEDYPVRPKHGFVFPFARWLQQSALRQKIFETLRDDALSFRAGLNPRAVRDIAEHAARMPWSRVWTLYVLLEWVRRHDLSV